MNRRTLLTGAGVGFVTPFAGCLSIQNMNTSGNGNSSGNTQEREMIEEDPRIDKPPHEINPPEKKDDEVFDPEDWNEDYLGKQIDQEPSIALETLLHSSTTEILHEPIDPNDGSYRIQIIANDSDYKNIFNLDKIDQENREHLNAVDFSNSVLLVVEAGRGSSTVQHRWSRVVDIDEGLHLHGYYNRPAIVHSDIAPRVSVLEVEPPSEELSFARVSLTLDEDNRIHFNSTEGVVEADPWADEATEPDSDSQ